MIDEDGLRITIIGIYKYLKMHQENLNAARLELAALRGVLERVSDGKYLPLLQEELANTERKGGVALSAQVSRLEQAIEQLKAGEKF